MVETRWNMRRYAALQRHWLEFGPPIHASAAAYLGIAQVKPNRPAADDFEQFMQGLAPGGVG